MLIVVGNTYAYKRNQKQTCEVQEVFNGLVTMLYNGSVQPGKQIRITEVAFKNWWVPIEEVEQEKKDPLELLNIDPEVVNTPYPESTEKKYIPKPQSVIEYEEQKASRGCKVVKQSLPVRPKEAIIEEYRDYIKKINSTYFVMSTGDWLEFKSGYYNLYATENTWRYLLTKHLKGRNNGSVSEGKARPFVFKLDEQSKLDTYLGMFNV